MAELQQQESPAVTEASPADQALMDYGDKLFKKLSRNRFIEELNWYETALMYQNKQWLKLTGTGRSAKYEPIQQDLNKPKPMPVSNYLADAINTLANKLGARIPEMIAEPDDDSDENREAADYAERACEEADKESSMVLLNPVLAKHVACFGTGITKDYVDQGPANLQMPELGTEEQQASICMDCGADVPPGSQACPSCASQNIEPLSSIVPIVKQVLGLPSNKLTTDVKLVFSVYVPRDCKDANLSKIVVERIRMSRDKAEERYSVDLPADTTTYERSEFYEDALRSLGGFGSQVNNSEEQVTFTEIWHDFASLPKKVKDALQGDPQLDMQTVQRDGLMWVYCTGKLVEKKTNNLPGKPSPYTFFQWEKDPANPYCKAPADDLKPLQKQLNRLDSLTERYLMTGGGKWLVPKTQQGSFQATGDPVDLHYWDPIGDGKIAPQFIPGMALGVWIANKRQSILNDIDRISKTQGVGAGIAPSGVKSFRGVAYLGQKSDEQLDTPRYLFEQAHWLRKQKVLLLAQKYWDEPRKVRVAGFNGRSSAAMLDGRMLDGDYDLDWIEGSSRKKTLDEEMEQFQLLLEAGLVDVADSQTRDFIFDRLNLQGVNIADHLQYQKAIRDLGLLKKGVKPRENPFIKWDIPLKVISEFCQTEEFEALDPQVQMFIEEWCQYLSDKLTAIKMNTQPAGEPGQDPNAQLAGALQGAMGNPLNGVPGKTDGSGQVEKAAGDEAKNVEQQVSPA